MSSGPQVVTGLALISWCSTHSLLLTSGKSWQPSTSCKHHQQKASNATFCMAVDSEELPIDDLWSDVLLLFSAFWDNCSCCWTVRIIVINNHLIYSRNLQSERRWESVIHNNNTGFHKLPQYLSRTNQCDRRYHDSKLRTCPISQHSRPTLS